MEIIMKERYLLMHKNYPIAFLNIEDGGNAKLLRLIPKNEDHFPIGARLNNSKFAEWWKNRYIPDNRKGIQEALKKANYQSTGNALVDNLALSLSDCYWIKPIDSDLTWEKVSLFINDFDDRIGEFLLNPNAKMKIKKNKFDIGSSSGELKKKWIIDENGERMLIKGNFGISFQQSINEVFISKIHQELNPKYCLHYELKEIISDGKKTICCISPNFCNDHAEFVSALEIIDAKKVKGSDNVFRLFKQGCLDLGIGEDDFDSYMDYLILTDYLFTNTDRHLRNIGILRDPDTLELLGFSPIFDNGNSMFYDKSYADLKQINLSDIHINSFYAVETRMLKNVKNYHLIHLEEIHPDFSLFKNDVEENQMRYELIEQLFYKKLESLRELQRKHPKK